LDDFQNPANQNKPLPRGIKKRMGMPRAIRPFSKIYRPLFNFY
jgi:hypothetical protein